MPAIATTNELFPKATTSLAQVQDELNLRIAAGAIRSRIDAQSDAANYILITEWNVLGQNDVPGVAVAQAAGSLSAATGTSGGPPTQLAAIATLPDAFASNAILAGFHANGASAKTAAQDRLPPGPEASRTMATTDLGRVTGLKASFTAAAATTGLPPALLAAIASRESRCGNVLDPSGFGDGGEGFGIMQVDRRSHALAGLPNPRSQAHITQAAGILRDALNDAIAKFPTALPARQLQAAVAAYNCGSHNVASPDTADAVTTGHDYSNDVWERGRFYAMGW